MNMMEMSFTDLNTVHKPALNLHIVCVCTVLLICKIFLSEKEFQILFIYCTEFCVPIKKVGSYNSFGVYSTPYTNFLVV